MGRGMGLQASHRPAASCRHRIRRFEIGAAKPATSRASFISFRPARAGYLAQDRTAAAGRGRARGRCRASPPQDAGGHHHGLELARPT
jgi:hypothetical protein